ncbi:MAG: hypothetical protein RJQ04_09035 [Longimicrobiales bacterium]
MAAPSTTATLGALWGGLGVAGLLGVAVVRLGARGWTAVEAGLTPVQWAALAVLTAVFVQGEGRMALQRRWVPAVIEPLRTLRSAPAPALLVLAPLHGLALVGVDAGTAGRAWAGVAAVVAAVLLVGTLPQPWRGITDLAVAAALTWGLACVLGSAPSLFRSRSSTRPEVEGS